MGEAAGVDGGSNELRTDGGGHQLSKDEIVTTLILHGFEQPARYYSMYRVLRVNSKEGDATVAWKADLTLSFSPGQATTPYKYELIDWDDIPDKAWDNIPAQLLANLINSLGD